MVELASRLWSFDWRVSLAILWRYTGLGLVYDTSFFFGRYITMYACIPNYFYAETDDDWRRCIFFL
jgi:hypothetical protein